MSIRYLFEKRFFVLLWLSLFFFLCAAASGWASDDIVWQSIETKYTIVHYQSVDDLRKFNCKVKYGQQEWGLKRLFSTTGSDTLIHRIITKVDLLFERVREILDMRRKMEKVAVRIYHNKKQLHDAYFETYKKSCRIRAWYRYRNNTVYINVDDLHEGMLAHELAHSIIDHYLLIRPPVASAEILARYVDSHLKE